MKAILVDDESLALQYLESQLNKTKQVTVVDTFTLFEIEKNIDLLKEIQIAFLDIEMPGMNGIEMAEKIVEINPNIMIIFVTAYNQYAIEAFEVNALDYILKPATLARLEKTIERIAEQQKELEDNIINKSQQLQINVCADLTFYLAGEEQLVTWRTAKAKELFLYLLLNKEKVIHKENLIELLWENIEMDKAYQLLYTTIYHIRRALHTFSRCITIKNRQDGYILTIENTTIDLIKWEREVDRLRPLTTHNIEQYEEIMTLYKSGYLHHLDYYWAETERFRLEEKWTAIALKIGMFYYEKKSYQKAESWLTQVCQIQPDHEEANFNLMKLYAALNYGLLVNYQYEKFKQSLTELDLTLSQEIEEWFNSWLKSSM